MLHGLHLVLVAVPASAMGAGLSLERRKGLRQRQATVGEPTPEPLTPGPPAFVAVSWLSPLTDGVGPHPRNAPVAHPEIGRNSLWLPAVAVAATGAALTHLVVIPEHFNESLLYGTFFLFAATWQILWAVMVACRPTRGALVAGALGCAATVVLWLVSRTFGIPGSLGGVGPGTPEAAGALDVLATVFESVAILGVTLALRDDRLVRRPPSQ